MKPEKKPRTPRPGKSFPIVAIGASAGGLHALECFLAALPRQFDFGLVFMQHLSAKHKSLLPDLIRARHAHLAIEEIKNGQKVRPGKLYLCPPAKETGIEAGVFTVKGLSKDHLHLPIDELFISLAEDVEDRAIGVVFSGAGTDGARGIQAIRAMGGSVLVQDPATAEFTAMPQAAINTGQADFILPPAEIVREILKLCGPETAPAGGDDGITLAEFDAFYQLILQKTGYRFHHYKKSVVSRRISRRMHLQGVASVQDYARLIADKEAEAGLLAADLMIGVTAFFRDHVAWKALLLEVIRKLAAESSDAPIRVWAPACSTGEEPYSIVMLLLHELALAENAREVQVFATDVNDRALEKAREGLYPGSIAADLPAGYLQKYFTNTEDGLSVLINKEVRERVVFAKQDLLNDPPFSKLDLVICRNFLIYLDPAAQDKCISLFHYALKDNGALFLGNAESIGSNKALFKSASHKKCRIYRKTGSQRAVRMPLSVPYPPEHPATASGKPVSAADARRAIADVVQDSLLEEFSPAAIAINQYYDILYHSGPTNRYLRQPRGIPTQNLLELFPDTLRNKVRGGIYRAAKESKPVSILTSISVDKRKRPVLLRFSKLRENLFLVLFQEKKSRAEKTDSGVQQPVAVAEENVVRQLETELAATKQDLQSHIEQLKSLNEELHSSNEELQAANEELETSREELQSLNEELVTVNSQLQIKIEEQEETNNDLGNFLSSTNIPTIFLDHLLRVKRFTPAMSKLIQLLPTDAGRPIKDFSQENLGPDLIADAQSVLENLVPIKKESRFNDTVYVRTTLPYRTSDNRIEGVVITYNDVTDLKRVQEKLSHAKDEWERTFDSVPDLIAILDNEHRVRRVNKAMAQRLGLKPAQCVGLHCYEAVHGLSAPPAFCPHSRTIGDCLAHLEEVHEDRLGGDFLVSTTPLSDGQGRIIGSVHVAHDITQRKRMEEANARLAALVESSEDAIIGKDLSGTILSWNTGAERLFGYKADEAIGKPITLLLPPGVQEEEKQTLLRLAAGERVEHFDTVRVTKDGRRIEVSVAASPIKDSNGRIIGASKIARNITERKRVETTLRESEERYRGLFENMTAGLAYCEMIFENGEPRDFIYNSVNHAFETLTGLKDVVGRKVTEVIPGIREADPELFQIYGRVSLTGKPEKFEMYLEALKMWFSVSVYSPAQGFFVAVFDVITERKRAEAELFKLNRALKALSDNSQAIIRAKGEQEYLDDVCRIVVEDCGYSMVWIGFAEEDEAKSVRPVAHAGFEKGYLETLNITWSDTDRGRGPTGTAIRTGKMTACPNMLTDPIFMPWREQAIKRGYASSIVFPLLAAGKAFGAISIYSKEADPFTSGEIGLLTELADNLSYGIEVLRTRTAREKARAALQRSHLELAVVNEELESFIYSVSHDLRAPLRSISGFTKIVNEDYAELLDAKGKDYLSRIYKGTERMSKLIEDLLRLSRISKQDLVRTPVDLSSLASQSIAELRQAQPDRSVVADIEGGLTAAADQRLIVLALTNLLDNAWKFTSKTEHARIEFGARNQDGKTVYYIRDNGAGFDPAYARKMFLPFHRLHLESEFEGTGIGLTIVERVIRRHGGSVWTEGEIGKGTTVYFTLG
jgi:two-component system CheB/CheR fusion protein